MTGHPTEAVPPTAKDKRHAPEAYHRTRCPERTLWSGPVHPTGRKQDLDSRAPELLRDGGVGALLLRDVLLDSAELQLRQRLRGPLAVGTREWLGPTQRGMGPTQMGRA